MALNLKSMLGFDPSQIETFVRQMAAYGAQLAEEQKRQADFQNVIAEAVLNMRRDIAAITAQANAIAAAMDLADCQECPAVKEATPLERQNSAFNHD